ncbi:Tyrosine-protein kinase ptk [Rosistilla carotiformis]|uniref:non-specific protein-tyrosine kinase n=1 Tax=Rosistilla carotiformis TaxID=2528017 RepID=A0A518JPH9_9BACT|nr:polysaccharide biosynthesis tyrosine autokinase [Rosistilla carotiformis]QDV67444.1 Tyrosine-protein kinase ptk [Rosistilla carotiformis]
MQTNHSTKEIAFPADGMLDSPPSDVTRILRRRWPLLLFGLVVGLGIAYAYHKNTKVVYQSSMDILVSQRASELMTSNSPNGRSFDASVVRADLLATHIALLKSPMILNDAIEVGNLSDLDSFVAARREGNSALGLLSGNLNIQRGGAGGSQGASVLQVTYQSSDPEDAEYVLEVVYERYCHHIESRTQNVGEEAAALIIQAQATNEQELQDATQAYTAFLATSVGMLDGEQLHSVSHDRLQTLEQEIAEVRSQLVYAKSKLESIAEIEASGSDQEQMDIERLALLNARDADRLKFFMDIANGDVGSTGASREDPLRAAAINLEHTKVLGLMLREQALTADYGDEHPLVQRVRDELTSVRNYINEKAPTGLEEIVSSGMTPSQILTAFSTLLNNDIKDLSKRQQHLMEEAATVRVAAKAAESEFLEGTALKAKMTRAQQRYDVIMGRLQELELTSDYAGFTIDLLSPPGVGGQIWPKLSKILMNGALAGLLVGGLLAFWAEYADQTFRDPSDLERSLNANVIAHVPRFQVTRKEKKAAKQSSLSPLCRTVFAPHSVESEVLTMARTSLFVHTGQTDENVIQVTSPMPGDGKSTMTVNVAAAIAKAGKRVLLIDADLRRPTLYKLLGIQHPKGLAEYLMGDASLEEVTVSSEIPGLDFICHGHHASEPAELLESFALETLIAEARQDYDFVFIDSPPLLAVADPLIIAAQADTVLMVVRVQKNGRRPVERSRELLTSNKIKVAGIIVNGAERGDKNFGYGEYVKPYEYGYATQYTKSYSSKPQPRPVSSASV